MNTEHHFSSTNTNLHRLLSWPQALSNRWPNEP